LDQMAQPNGRVFCGARICQQRRAPQDTSPLGAHTNDGAGGRDAELAGPAEML